MYILNLLVELIQQFCTCLLVQSEQIINCNLKEQIPGITIMSDEEDETVKKKANALPLWGNAQTMNINNLIVTNILSSPYFKNELIKLKTFHEVIDEIYYKVSAPKSSI